MPSLKDLRNRIASVKATQKITKAMQMVAAAKLRRAQEAAEAARPYAERMEHVLANLGAAFQDRDDAPRLLAGTGAADTHLLVVMAADRGLAGGFNSAIAKLARQRINALQGDGKTVKIVTVGKKAYDLLRRDFDALIVERRELRSVRQIDFDIARDIGAYVMNEFDAGAFDVCTLFYSRFQSVISQIPTEQQIVPAKLPEDATARDELGEAVYEYEPDEATILNDLLPRNIAVQIFSALLENAASEQGARMSAMDSATRNAGEMIGSLTLSYNRQRQAQITKELIEIISGAEAL